MTNAEQQHFLEQNLRPLQTPHDSLWWPLATGWWIVAALFSVLMVGLLYHYRRNRMIAVQPDYVSRTTTQLETCFRQWQTDRDTVAYIQRIRTLLKQSAVKYAGRSTVARLHGCEWLEWMERETASTFTTSTKALLSDNSYQKAPPSPTPQIHAEITDWHQRYIRSARKRIEATINSKRIDAGPDNYTHGTHPRA